MASSYNTFQRLKDKGVSAYKVGDYAVARSYLLQAAECSVQLAEETPAPDVRRQYEELAEELMDLARACSHRRRLGGGPRRKTDMISERDDGGGRVGDWIVRERPNIRFDDIAGLDDVKAEIKLKMIYPFTYPELAQRYGVSVGGGLLLFGPPGTGKTMIAKAIACEIEATMFVVSPAEILSKWVGEAEQNVKKLFDAAQAEDKAVIFIDEVEALVPRRKSDSSTVMARVVPQILQELEGFDRNAQQALLMVGATNKPWLLDEAIRRPGRFDAQIYVPLPDAPARYRLLEIYLGPRPVAEDVDFGVLCDRLDGYSGADIKNIAVRAATIPFLESVTGKEPRAITMADITAVIDETPPSVRAGELKRYQDFAATGA
jgi:transitional endoplasmic reticulum ATPase